MAMTPALARVVYEASKDSSRPILHAMMDVLGYDFDESQIEDAAWLYLIDDVGFSVLHLEILSRQKSVRDVRYFMFAQLFMEYEEKAYGSRSREVVLEALNNGWSVNEFIVNLERGWRYVNDHFELN